MTVNVQIVLFDGFDLLDVVAPYEVFCAAAMYAEHAHAPRVQLVTAEGPRPVRSGVKGITMEASGRLNPECAGIILVPGASGDVEGEGDNSVPAILGRALNTELTGLVGQALGRQDIVIATVCGGSLLLAMGGLLEGRPAVTHHLGMTALGVTGAIPVAARVVDDGNLVTSGGVTSGLDLALHLVERELGPRIAHAVEQLFEFERRGTVWRAAGMAPVITPLPTENSGVAVGITPIPSETDGTPGPDGSHSSAFEGTWDTTIATPVGNMQARLFISTKDGAIEANATQGNETIPFMNPAIMDGRLTWQLRITKPLRLNLKFEVSVDGDRMTGTAKAGMLPASKVTGKRVV